SLPSNTIANPKGKLKAITTRSGIVLDGPSVHIPLPFINPEEDERVKETLTDQDLVEYTIKVPPPLVQKSKPPSQRNFVVHQRDPLYSNIPYPSRMLKEKQQEKVLKPLFPSPIPVEDSDSFLEKSNTFLSLPEYETFIDHTEETNSGSTTTHTFYFDIEEKNSGSTTIHADISLPDLESFNLILNPIQVTDINKWDKIQAKPDKTRHKTKSVIHDGRYSDRDSYDYSAERSVGVDHHSSAACLASLSPDH
nr:hypothetical protein [Tanacetum cinerariifolium]